MQAGGTAQTCFSPWSWPGQPLPLWGEKETQPRAGRERVDTESFQLLYLYNSAELNSLLKPADLCPFQHFLHTVPLFFFFLPAAVNLDALVDINILSFKESC